MKITIPLGEGNIRRDGNLALGQLSCDVSAQVAHLLVELDVLLQVSLLFSASKKKTKRFGFQTRTREGHPIRLKPS